MIKSFLGNQELLKLHKTAFLCSRKIPASIVLKCYDWAIEQREKGVCIIGGFHSVIEKDVFHYLLAGTQPIIMALARGMQDRFDRQIRKNIDKGRLLIVTPFDSSVKRVTAKTAEKRNKFMIDLADRMVAGFISKGGMLEKLFKEKKTCQKSMTILKRSCL